MKLKTVLAVIFSVLTDLYVPAFWFFSSAAEQIRDREFDPYPMAVFIYAAVLVLCVLVCVCTYLFTQLGRSRAVFVTALVSAIAMAAVTVLRFYTVLSAITFALAIFFAFFAVFALCAPKRGKETA